MSLLLSPMAKNSSAGFYNGVATQSLRFDDVRDSKLTRTPSSSGNQKKWTSSFWVKRSKLGTTQYLWSGGSYDGNNGIAAIYFANDDKIHTYFDTSGANPVGAVNARLYRDISTWYHIVWAVDAANTVQKIWVNGVEETLASGNNPPNYDYGMNRSGTNQAFGVAAWGGSNNLDGYLAEIVHLDNQYLDETSFGEFKNGVWIAKDTSDLTFGTNGFILKLDQVGVGTASTSTIGADTSGNTNHFTSSGIVASDCSMIDSPENNFATGLGGLSESTNDQSYIAATWSEGNLKMTPSSAAWNNGMSNFGMTSGKWYAEAKVVNIGPNGGYTRFGMRASPTRTYDEYMWLANGNGQIDAATSPYSDRVGTYANGNVLQIALDLENNALYFGKNGTWENSATTSEIAAGTVTNAFASGTTLIPTGDGFTYFFYFNMHGHGTAPIHIWNFGQDPSFAGEITAGTETPSEGAGVFLYAPPDGFLACCTANLPEPTIGPNSATQADDYFNTVLYTGNATARSITGVGFQPDWTWIKCRSDAYRHVLTDSSRGATKSLYSNLTDAEVTDTGGLTAFNSGGFSLGATANVNANTETFVAWNWLANGGTTTTNDASSTGVGSIDSVYQANTTAGFSIVTYTGTGSAGSIAHGLGAVPKMIITKTRSHSGDWMVYHGANTSAPQTDFLKLNETNATEDLNTVWNDTAPTSSVFTLGSNGDVNTSGRTQVAYCFAEVEGYSKIGSYLPNANADGTFIYMGFQPAWVMIKQTNGTTNWNIYDNTRRTFNGNDLELYADLNNAEEDSGRDIDFLSNGIKLRSVNYMNVSGGTYIYMAFAEAPFKYANAR